MKFDRNDPDFDRNNPGPRLVKHLESEIVRLEDDLWDVEFKYLEVAHELEIVRDGDDPYEV